MSVMPGPLRTLTPEPVSFLCMQVGEYLLQRLQAVKQLYPAVIGDVRGLGLMAGVEVVRDPLSRLPAPRLARWIKVRRSARV